MRRRRALQLSALSGLAASWSLAAPSPTLAHAAQEGPTAAQAEEPAEPAEGAAESSSAPLQPPQPAPELPALPVALTFDAGADRGYAGSILDLLIEEGVPASFGITGNWARANPDLVQRMGAEGHLLLNHTVSHRSFTGLSDRLGGLSAERRRAELEEADAILAPLIGRSTRPWYRLPYGDSDSRVAADVAPTGYTRHAGWTADSLGWQGLSAPQIVVRCLRLAAPRAIYLFHVGSAARDGPALGAIIGGLRQQGYGFVTLETLP